MKKFIFPALSLIFCLFLSCTKETVVVQEVLVEQEAVFEKLRMPFPIYNRIYNIKNTGDLLYMQGEELLGYLLPGDTIPQWILLSNNNSNSEPITEDIAINIKNYSIEFLLPTTSYSSTEIYLDSIEANIISPSLREVYSLHTKTLVSGNHVLFPYRTEDDNTLKFCIFRLEFGVSEIGIDEVIIAEKTLITFDDVNYGTYYYSHLAVNDGFIFNANSPEIPTANRVFKIAYNGEITEIGNRSMPALFQFRNKIYGVDQGEEILEYSEASGIFNTRYTYENFVLPFIQFREIEDKLLGFTGDQILIFTEWNDSGFLTKELKNHEIKDSHITDIEKFDDDVFISTYSGVYRRSWEDFVSDFKEN